MCSGLLEITLRIGTDKQHGNEYKHVHGEIFSLDYMKLDYTKWVYRAKNWLRKKFGWSTFHFRVVILDPIALC